MSTREETHHSGSTVENGWLNRRQHEVANLRTSEHLRDQQLQVSCVGAFMSGVLGGSGYWSLDVTGSGAIESAGNDVALLGLPLPPSCRINSVLVWLEMDEPADFLVSFVVLGVDVSPSPTAPAVTQVPLLGGGVTITPSDPTETIDLQPVTDGNQPFKLSSLQTAGVYLQNTGGNGGSCYGIEVFYDMRDAL